jgi:hypothetical protein
MLRFLQAFTTYREPDAVRLRLAEGPRVDRAFFVDAHERTSAMFGPAKRRLVVAGAAEEHERCWALRPEDVGNALLLMADLEPFPAHWLEAPLALSVQATFGLCDPDSGHPFARQDPDLYRQELPGWGLLLGMSRIYLRLTTASTCAIYLSLPFDEVTPWLKRYVERLDHSLPFRLSKKRWSRWQLNAQGTRYYSRSISMPEAT